MHERWPHRSRRSPSGRLTRSAGGRTERRATVIEIDHDATCSGHGDFVQLLPEYTPPATTAPPAPTAPLPPPPTIPLAFTVTAVVDGDTIDITDGSQTLRVRLIGIDAPESGGCAGAAATWTLAELVQGEQVILTPGGDSEDTDEYGRLLRYVDVNGVDLAAIIDLVWRAKPRTVLFEAANPRHAHEWTLFEEATVPDDKVICPGVIEPQSNYIEHPELVAQRIELYAALVGRDRVMAGVDCGFSVHVGLQGIDPDVAWAKLQSLARGAEIATGRLWRSTRRIHPWP